ncbi:hypothetical protein WN943_011813 [Citrus x changshan-huyou]
MIHSQFRQKNSLVSIWQSFPFSLSFFIHFFIDFFLFIAAVPRFRSPFIPPFPGSGNPSWDSNCYIVGKRGISHLLQRFWEKRNYRDSVRSCSRSLGDRYRLGLWSVYSSGWYSSRVGPCL